MLEIVSGCIDTKWFPISAGATIYVGSLVCVDMSALNEGIVVREQADGAANRTNRDWPLGICIGTNRREPVFNSTYLSEYITDEGATGVRSSTTDYVGVEGPWGKGSKMAMAQVAIIGPGTVIKAPIRNNSIGTAITELTSASGAANGLSVTTDATDVQTVANLCTIYCRAGLNAGQYRIVDSASTTAHTWDHEMLQTTATVGETYVTVPVRSHGISYVRIGDDTVASYINASESPGTDYDIIHVLELNLAESGREFCKFMFDMSAFLTYDAVT